jgi:PAS domain S-box-containing protein
MLSLANAHSVEASVAIDQLQSILSKVDAALDCADLAIAWIDAQGNLQGSNLVFDRLVDLPHQPLPNQPLVELLPFCFRGEVLPATAHPSHLALTTGSPGKERYELNKKKLAQNLTSITSSPTSQWLEIAWSALPSLSSENPPFPPKTEGAVFVIRDITPQVLTEQILQHALWYSERQTEQPHALTQENQKLQQQLQTEISQRQQLEAQLQQQQAILEASSHGVALLDSTGRYAYLNTAYAQTLGYEAGQAWIGQSWQVHYPASERQRLEQDILPLLSHQICWHGEITILRANGDLSPQQISLTRLTDGSIAISCRSNPHPQLTAANLRQLNQELEQRVGRRTAQLEQLNQQLQLEIAEHQQTEIALRLRQQAIAASSNGIVIADASHPDLPLIYVNPAFEQQTGYTATEVLGRNCRFLQGTDGDQAELKRLRSAIQKGQHCTVMLRNYRKDGTLFWNQLTISPIYDEQHTLTHFVGIQTDISDRKRAEDNLRESEERLRFALDAWELGKLI